jgi:hypothetical protein
MREAGGGDTRRTGVRQLRKCCALPRPERATWGSVPGVKRRGDVAAARRDRDPALEARAGGRAEERPVQRDEVELREPTQPPKEARSPFGRGQVPHRPRRGLELVEEIAVHHVETIGRACDILRGRCRRALGHELEPLQHPGRKHRPDHQCRRSEVVPGDPAREGQRRSRKERPIGPDPVYDRLGGHPGRRAGRAQDHAESLTPPELHEHGLAILEIRERLRDGVRERSRAGRPGCVDRDLHEAARPGCLGARSTRSRLVPGRRSLAHVHPGAFPRPGRAGPRAAVARWRGSPRSARPSAPPGRSR